jgi:hypothetical protein
MKQGLITKFDRLMTAVTFAEEGEFETAREIMREDTRVEKRSEQRPDIRPEMRKQQPIKRAN